MPGISKGSTPVNSLKLGGSNVSEVYYGSKKVWPAGLVLGPWLEGTVCSWTFPQTNSNCRVPDVGPAFTGDGGTNVAVDPQDTGIVGDSRAMFSSSGPAYSNNAAVAPLKRIDLNPVFVQARVNTNDVSTASGNVSVAGAYSSSTSRDWEFGFDAGTGEVRVRIRNTSTEFLSGLFLPPDGTWHDICFQSDPTNKVIRLGMDGVITTGVQSGIWGSSTYSYIGVMGSYQNRGWVGRCSQIRMVAGMVIPEGTENYIPGDYQYASGPV